MASQSPQNSARKNPLAGLFDSDDDIEVIIDSDEGSEENQHVEIALEDGGFEIDLDPPRQSMGNPKFFDNLAKFLPDGALHSLSSTLVQLIEQDDNDRKEWLQERADGLDLLGMKIQKPSAAAVTSSTTSGQSTVRDPILAEAIDRFQANAFSELVPSNGPAKFVNYGEANAENEALANAMSKDLNFYLCSGSKGTATEYAPDTRKMLWWVGYSSGMFKKVYRCPIRRRPVSESVDGEFLIVPANVTDIENAGRVTHVTTMRQSVMKRMQILGVYRDIPLPNPTPHSTILQDAKDRVTGISPSHALDEDTDYTVYECYCELDLEGFEHKDEKGRKTGLPLPYRVSIERDSRTILEIRRNWDENDEDQKAKIPFVLFPYATGLSIYGTGLLQRLGNPAIALTAMLRELIDAGMFASFPGMLIAEPATRQKNTNLRVPPGGAAPIDVSATGNDINKAVMALPYKDPSPALVDTRKALREEASRYGNMADLPVGEGRQDAPVGTMLAMIEQGMKVVTGVLKGLHSAQKSELNKIVDLFRDHPDDLWRGNPRPALGLDAQKRRDQWKRGLEICEITPASDPNEPSDMHRAGKAQLLKQMTVGNPMYDQAAIDRRIFAMFGIDDFDAMLAKGPPQQQPDPLVMAGMALKERELQLKEMALAQKAHADEADRNSREQIEAMKIASGAAQPNDNQPDPMKQQEMSLKHRALGIQETKMHLDHSNEQANRDSREAVEAMKIAATVGVHPEAEGVVDDQLEQMRGFLLPAAADRRNGGGVDGDILPPRRGGRLSPDDAYLAQAIVEALSHLRQ